MLDKIMTAEKGADVDTKEVVAEVSAETTPAVSSKQKMVTCNGPNCEGEEQFKLGFNFRQKYSEKINGTNPPQYKDRERWYNICVPCGELVLSSFK